MSIPPSRPSNLGAPPVAIGPVYTALVELMIPLPFPDMPESEVALVSVADASSGRPAVVNSAVDPSVLVAEDSRLSAEGDVAAAAAAPIGVVLLAAPEPKQGMTVVCV